MRDTVLYVGGFGLPDRTASALRALCNAAVLRAAGYRVVIAGKFEQIKDRSMDAGAGQAAVGKGYGASQAGAVSAGEVGICQGKGEVAFEAQPCLAVHFSQRRQPV